MSSAAKTKPPASAFLKRILSSLILAPVVIALIIYGHWPFLMIVSASALLCSYEFLNMVQGRPFRVFHTALGLLYFCVCFGCFIFIRMGFEQGAWLSLALIMCVWASDIGAYLLGKMIGGPKMAPKLSPNKTWAGLCGAMVFCGLLLIVLQISRDVVAPFIKTDLALTQEDLPFIFIIGLMLGLVGQAGDLLESFYKRRAGVKDAGNLIPGHGGLLDRIDSLLLVSPVFLVILLLCL